MSALDHWRTCAVQTVMSALPQKRTLLRYGSDDAAPHHRLTPPPQHSPMTRYKGQLRASRTQEFPHHVDIVVPPGGLGTRLDAMYDFTLNTVSSRNVVKASTTPMGPLFSGVLPMQRRPTFFESYLFARRSVAAGPFQLCFEKRGLPRDTQRQPN